jgi:hypothetical protein
MTALLVGTGDGLWMVEDGGPPSLLAVPERKVTAVAAHADGWVAVTDGREIWTDESAGAGEPVATVDVARPEATCVAGPPAGALVGTAEAHLLRVVPPGTEMVGSFEDAEGRDGWYTPWGGPPDTRSLSVAPDGSVYVNVHVGGILRSDDGGGRWAPTIDVDADVHQVLALDGVVLAATAYGLAVSRDRGATWTFSTEGLHGDYSRAVAVAGDWLLLSASTGPSTRQAAVYRRPLEAGDDAPFERCINGLPEWFGANVDTGSLVAGPSVAALAAGDTLFTSEDGGATWQARASGLGRITCLAVTARTTSPAA